MKLELDIETLRGMLSYDPETGALTWKKRDISLFPDLRSCNSWNSRYAGTITGQKLDEWGYQDVSIFSVKYKAHRVCWAIFYGEWPSMDIDHKNRDGSDNRINNLREATPLQNAQNKGSYQNNTSGYKGVCWHKSSKKWMAQIKYRYKNIHLGLFDDPEDASRAYQKAVIEIHGVVS